MIKRSVDQRGKGWFAGPWDGSAPVGLGYADLGVDDPHVHDEMYEIYPIARGSSSAEVNGEQVELQQGDLLRRPSWMGTSGPHKTSGKRIRRAVVGRLDIGRECHTTAQDL